MVRRPFDNTCYKVLASINIKKKRKICIKCSAGEDICQCFNYCDTVINSMTINVTNKLQCAQNLFVTLYC